MVFKIYIQGTYCPKVTTSSLVVILISIFLRSAVCFKCKQPQTSSPNCLILNCDPLCVLSNVVTTCLLHSGLSGIKYGNGTSNFVKPCWTLTRSLTTRLNSPHWFLYLLSWKLGQVLIRQRLSLMVVKWLSLSQYRGGATTIGISIYWLTLNQEQDMQLRVVDLARGDQWTKSWPKYQVQVLVQVGKRNPSEALEALGAQDFRWCWKLISIDFRQKERKRSYIVHSEVMSKICGHWRSTSSPTKSLFSPSVLLILPW